MQTISIAQNIRAELLKLQDEKDNIIDHEKFFKEDIAYYGVKSICRKNIVKKYLKLLKDVEKPYLFDICVELWKSNFLEESIIACDIAYSRHKEFKKHDFSTFEYWLNSYVSNWAACDALCNHTIGELLIMFPELVDKLKVWCLSENRWVRRGSAVSLIIPAKKGLFLEDIQEIAKILLKDEDDLVRKGCGWMLKAASQVHLNEIFRFIYTHKFDMPRVILRYAIEKMPPEFKAKAMQK